MVVLALLHLVQAFLWGAFKKPREMTWILGTLLLLATLGAVFTGNPLAWDEKGYWAARVGAGIASSVPLVGGWLHDVVFGGPTVGQLTITRFFGLHVAVIPIIIAAVLATHLSTFRREGAAGPFARTTKPGPFYPDQVLRDLVVFAVVLALMIGLSALLPTPVTGAADSLDASYTARPDWPFLFLFQILKYLPGQLEALGTVGVPMIGTLLLLLVPWLNRSAERSPVKIGGADHGSTLFVLYCVECHAEKGTKGVENPGSADGEVPSLNPIDPEITGKTTQEFVDGLDAYLQNGSVPEAATSTPNASPRLKMPSFGNTYALTQPQIADLEAYVMRLNEVDRAAIVKPGVAPRIYFWVSLVLLGLVAIGSGVAIVSAGRSG